MMISLHRLRSVSPAVSVRHVVGSSVVFLSGSAGGWLLADAAGITLSSFLSPVDSSPWSILAHNLGVVVSLAIGALTLGVVTVAVLALNGVVLGAAAQLFVEAGRAGDLWTGVAPHFLPEMAAFLLAASADLWLAAALWQWMRRGVVPAPAELVRRWVAPHVAVLVLLATAAAIEASVSVVG